jgi:hypothetical protein
MVRDGSAQKQEAEQAAKHREGCTGPEAELSKQHESRARAGARDARKCKVAPRANAKP